MLSNEDRAEVMKMIAEAKRELRAERNDASNRNHEDKQGMKQTSESHQSVIDYNIMMENLEDPEVSGDE